MLHAVSRTRPCHADQENLAEHDGDEDLEANVAAFSAEYGAVEDAVDDDNENWEAIEKEPEAKRLLQNDTLAKDVDDKTTIVKGEDEQGLFATLANDFRTLRLVLVFELLMASVILALLLQSTPIVQWLWPASKSLLLAAHPHWTVVVGVSIVAALLVLICACLS